MSQPQFYTNSKKNILKPGGVIFVLQIEKWIFEMFKTLEDYYHYKVVLRTVLSNA